MDHDLEQLGPDRFQELCQALLASEYPALQCLPVGQADGGRDALLRGAAGESETVVFQVKFKRNPAAVTNPLRELAEDIEREELKVRRLAGLGATRYVLITNLRGTGPLEVGQIDRLQALLDEKLPIPASCMWRDDVNRRLELHPELKWSYPELLRGTDVVRILLEKGLGTEFERRRLAIDAFLVHQYEEDSTVQFKQIDLHSSLLDLFVDVPCVLTKSSHARRYSRALLAETEERTYANGKSGRFFTRGTTVGRAQSADLSSARLRGGARLATESRRFRREALAEEGDEIGAASLLLDPAVQDRHPFMVVEGAPGQGKSTLGQYLCQVHRMRLLDDAAAMAELPDDHLASPLRLPFRADLRDLALWLQGDQTLETYLAHAVSHQSGGTTFTVADLQGVLATSAVLLLLDGLDEIADVSQRERVVTEISKGVKRLRRNAVSLQVIVTTRPVAFATSPGLEEGLFQYAELQSIGRLLIRDFAQRWIRAQTISDAEGAELLETLEAKLDEPHVRDLARNPMQLAILLTLLYTQGVALPSQRTALYDNYMKTFFDREVTKTDLVRKHRSLLVDIHRFLGWELHSQVELGKSNGTIRGSDLNRLLRGYLEKEGMDPDLADDLFQGAVDRVVAIVSPVADHFEFEVQTLREYFAARHLYETAPLDSVGQPKSGTRPDRFYSLARNFYWLNTARFYAGCHTRGELPSLADQLAELAEEVPFAETSHPSLLSSMLLSDWVFANVPRRLQNVVDLTVDGVGLRHAWMRGEQPVSLPDACGGAQLLVRCWSLLRQNIRSTFSYDLADVILANVPAASFDSQWLSEASSAQPEEKRAWVRLGLHSGSLGRLPWANVEEALSWVVQAPEGLEYLVLADRVEAFSAKPDWELQAIRSVLVGDILLDAADTASISGEGASVAGLLRLIHEPAAWLSHTVRSHVLRLVEGRSVNILDLDVADSADEQLLLECDEVLQSFTGRARDQANAWDELDITPLSHFVEHSRSALGTRWLHYHLAVGAAAFAVPVKGQRAVDLIDDELPLLQRARRSITADGNWWHRQFVAASTPEEAWAPLALLFAHARSSLVLSASDEVERLLGLLSSRGFCLLVHTVKVAFLENDGARLPRLGSNSGPPSIRQFDGKDLPSWVSARYAAMLAIRASESGLTKLYDSCGGPRIDSLDYGIYSFAVAGSASKVQADNLSWRRFLTVVSALYSAGEGEAVKALNGLSLDGNRMPVDMARMVMRSSHKYPPEIVRVADGRCRDNARATIVPLATTAERFGWFEPQ